MEFATTPFECCDITSCRGRLQGQGCLQSGFERCLLQDEDHSGSRPHSFLGLSHMHSRTSLERFRSGLELTGS